MISQRTKSALAAAKARGVRLGITGKIRAKKHKANANQFASQLAPLVIELQADGYNSFSAIARELNIRQIPTMKGRRWHAQTAKRLLMRVLNFD